MFETHYRVGQDTFKHYFPFGIPGVSIWNDVSEGHPSRFGQTSPFIYCKHHKRNRILPEKLIVTLLVHKFHSFLQENYVVSPCTGSCPKALVRPEPRSQSDLFVQFTHLKFYINFFISIACYIYAQFIPKELCQMSKEILKTGINFAKKRLSLIVQKCFWVDVPVNTPREIPGSAFSRRSPSRWTSSGCLKRQLNRIYTVHWGLVLENSMMKLAQLAHGEYDKNRVTILKHRNTCYSVWQSLLCRSVPCLSIAQWSPSTLSLDNQIRVGFWNENLLIIQH